jgi:hypothetical protein
MVNIYNMILIKLSWESILISKSIEILKRKSLRTSGLSPAPVLRETVCRTSLTRVRSFCLDTGDAISVHSHCLSGS